MINSQCPTMLTYIICFTFTYTYTYMLNDGGHMFLHYYYADPANYKCFSHISGTVSSKSNWHITQLHSVAMFVRIVVTKRLCWKVIWVLLSGVSSTRMWSDHTTTFSNYRSTSPQSGVNNHNPTQLIYALNDQPISQFVQAFDKQYRSTMCMQGGTKYRVFFSHWASP